MRPILLLLLPALAGLILPAPAAADGIASAQQRTDSFVERPDGERARLWRVRWAYGLEYNYYLDAEGLEVLHGPLTREYRGSRTRETTTYAHGRLDGPFTTVNGQATLLAKGQYRDGQLHGAVAFFYPSGGVKETEHYAAGLLNGPYRAFYEDGGLKERSRFVDGRKEGPVTWYHPSGEPSYRGTFRNGYLTGPLAVFDPAGHKVAEGTLEREWIVGGWRCYAPDGGVVRVRTDCDQEFYTRCDCP